MKPCTALEKSVAVFVRGTQLCVTYGLILTTPAKEIKKTKLRQIEKELKALKEG